MKKGLKGKGRNIITNKRSDAASTAVSVREQGTNGFRGGGHFPGGLQVLQQGEWTVLRG